MAKSVNESHYPVVSHSLDFDPISVEMKQYFHFIFLVIICGVISLFGILTNTVNIIVFVTQGFKESVHISFLSLAVADLSCVITMLWTSISGSPLVATSALPFNGFDVSYTTGAWPHVCFNRITSFITAFITLERCLCITMPLKVKDTFTSRKTKVINVSIFIIMFILFSPFYFVNSLHWIFNEKANRTLLTLGEKTDRILVEKATFPIHSVAMSVIPLVTVVVCTIVLVVSLHKKTKWRQTSVAKCTTQLDTASVKQKKVAKMVIFISTIFIVCYSPATVNFLVMVYNPDFSFTGKYGNLFVLLWCLTLVLETVSSSVNVFVYYKMSTKFRTTLVEKLSEFCFVKI